MKRFNSICSVASFVALLGALTLVSGGCGGIDDGNGGTVASDGTQATAATTSALTRAHRRHAPRTTTSTTTTGSTTTSTTTGGSPSGSATTSSQDVIAAAQTPDGAAIPQAAGPNGECPAVVVLVGFWSCPVLNQTCSFSSGGAAHNCVCSHVDGEGEFPSWVCQ